MSASFRSLIDSLNQMSDANVPGILNESDEMIVNDEIVDEEDGNNTDKNSSMSGIIDSMNDANDDLEDSGDLDDLANDAAEELETNPDDILNNPIIQQLMSGGSSALNLSQRKQALDLLKDYLGDIVGAKKTPSIGESK